MNKYVKKISITKLLKKDSDKKYVKIPEMFKFKKKTKKSF